MLEHLVVGWQEIEPLFLVNIALNKPFILLGRHGTCKTTCAKAIARIYGKKSFRFYDATRDDLISIAGIPIPQKLAQGKLEFSEHDRSIWQARVIVIDELTRANKENQNLWLEILEEKTCYGKKLCYEALIATMNPESYAATFKLDEALLDRFYAILPVPDLQKGTSSDTYKKVIRMNLKTQNLATDETKQLVQRIKLSYGTLHSNRIVLNTVTDYVAQFMEILLTKTDAYISPRKTVHLVEEILGLGAFFKTHGKDNSLIKAAQIALTHVIGIPFRIKSELLMQIHSTLKRILTDQAIDEADKIRIDLAKCSNNDQFIHYLTKNIRNVKKHLPFDETDKLLSQAVEQAENAHLPLLRDLMNRIEGHEEQKRIVEGRMLFYEIEAANRIQQHLLRYVIHNDDDFATFAALQSFIQQLKKVPFDRTIEKLVFKKEIDFRQIMRFIRKGGVNAVTSEAGSGLQRAGDQSTGHSPVRPDQRTS
jgi:MoxR-like ATPase